MLATINAQAIRESPRFAIGRARRRFFASAVAFYPGLSRGAGAPVPAGSPPCPRAILIGELDDWTPPQALRRPRRVGRGRSARRFAQGHGLPGRPITASTRPAATVAHRTDVPNGVNPGQGVHVGANPAMREEANAKLRGFLDEQLRGRLPD